VPSGECIAAAASPPSGVTPYASPLAALEALEAEDKEEGDRNTTASANANPNANTSANMSVQEHGDGGGGGWGPDGDAGVDGSDAGTGVGSLRTLNGSQRAAVASGLAQRFTLVQGPPGTGKTYTAVALTKAWLKHGLGPVLCCSESNVAVDNLVEGLIAAGVPAVRLGRPEAVRGDLSQHMVRHEGQLRAAAAVCCTCAAAGGDMLESARFGAVLLDEASQQVELASLVALARGARAVALVGDHRQLPPTVLSRAAEHQGMAVSLFDRLQAQGVAPVMLP